MIQDNYSSIGYLAGKQPCATPLDKRQPPLLFGTHSLSDKKQEQTGENCDDTESCHKNQQRVIKIVAFVIVHDVQAP